MANFKPFDYKDSPCLVSLYLEKIKITVFGSWPTLLIPFVRASSFLLCIFDGDVKSYHVWLEKDYKHGYNLRNLYLTKVGLSLTLNFCPMTYVFVSYW